MKKEEFFDTLEDVEQKYISEAFFDDLDDSLGVAKPGKAKHTPLKIFAPIAACLAVVIVTGAVASRLNKQEQSENSEQQNVQGELTVDPKAFVQVDFEDKDLKAIYDSNTIDLNFEPDELERDFIAECISIIKDENESAQQDGISWHVNKGYSLDYWYASYSYYFQPQIDGHGIADVGVRVFQKTKGYSSIYGETFDLWDNGGFAQGYEELDLDYVIDHFDYNDKYYYRTDTIGSAESISLREIYLKGDKQEIAEKTILEKIVDGDTITYLHDGKKIGEEEFIGIWNTYPYIPKFYTDFTNEEVEECREELKESLGLTDSLYTYWGDAEVDIDLDGTNELLISPEEHFDRYLERYGTYVFARTSDGIKQVGCFGTEDGDRSYCIPEEIRYRNVSATEYFPYYNTYDYMISDSSYASSCLVKIIPDGNGGVTTEVFAGQFGNYVDGQWEHHYEWFGEEVSEEAYLKTFYNYRDNCIDHEYHKPSVPTNPDNYAWD